MASSCSAGSSPLIVFAVRNQWQRLADSAAEGFDDLQSWLDDLPFPIDQDQITAARDSIVDFVTSAEFGAGALAGVSAATEFVAGTVLVLVVLFFFLKDGDRIWAFFMRPFHGERLERGRRVGVTSVKVLGGYVRGTAIIALVDAVVIGVGLAILQVPLALPLAVIVFLGAFIPLVGATVAGILAALVALVANGPIVALIVVAIVIVVNQVEGDLLQPVVMAQSLKLHPLVILIALTAGTILGGHRRRGAGRTDRRGRLGDRQGVGWPRPLDRRAQAAAPAPPSSDDGDDGCPVPHRRPTG